MRSRSAAVAAPRLWLLPLRSGRRNAKVRCESWLLPLPLLRLPCSSNLHNVRNIVVVSVDSHPFLCNGEWFISDCLRTRKKETCKELISQVLWSYHPSISIQFFIGLFDRQEIQIPVTSKFKKHLKSEGFTFPALRRSHHCLNALFSFSSSLDSE